VLNRKRRVLNRIVMPALVTRFAAKDGHVMDEENQ